MKMRAEFKETAQEQGRLEALRGSEGHGSSSAAVSCNGPYDTSDTAFGGTEVFHKTVYYVLDAVRCSLAGEKDRRECAEQECRSKVNRSNLGDEVGVGVEDHSMHRTHTSQAKIIASIKILKRVSSYVSRLNTLDSHFGIILHQVIITSATT